MNKSTLKYIRYTQLPVFFAVLSLIMITVLTGILLQKQGVGYMGDSSRFFDYGSKEGLSSLPIHDAPLYPFLLRIHRFTSLNVVSFSALANIILYPLAAFILFTCLFSISRSLVASYVATVITVFSWPFISTYSYAQTEVLFLPLLLASMFWLLHADARNSLRFAIFSGLAASFSIFTRYAGIFTLLAAGLYLVAIHYRQVVRLMRYAVAFIVAAGLPFLLLVAWNILRAGKATSRVFSPHPPSSEKLLGGLYWIMNYFLPYRILDSWFIPSALFFIFLLIAVILVLHLYGNILEKQYGIMCLTWSLAYIVFLYVSLTFFDDHTPLDERILSPLVLTTLCCIAYAVGIALVRCRSLLLRAAAVVIMSYMLVFTGYRAFGFVSNAYTNGLGFNRREVRESQSLKDAVSLSQNIKVYSNAPEAAALLYGTRNMRYIPYKLNPTSLLPNPGYTNQFESLLHEVHSNEAIVVLFYFKHKPGVWTHYLPDPDEIARRLNAVVIKEYSDGVIYGAKAVSNRIYEILGEPSAAAYGLSPDAEP